MKKILFFAVLLVSFPLYAKMQIPQKPTESIYVQDYAGLISKEYRDKINEYGKRLDEKTKAQIIVVTVDTLEGYPIEEFSLGILRSWGVGDKELNNGVLMLVSAKDRQSRIEVGYGLEGRITDAKAGNIQDDQMIPYFRKGDYEKGIILGYMALLIEVSNEYDLNIDDDILKAVEDNKTKADDSSPFWKNIIVFVIVVIIVLIIQGRSGGGRGGRSGGFGGGSGFRSGRGSSGGGGFRGGSGGGGGAGRRW